MEVRLFATLRNGRDKVVDAPWHEGMDGYALFSALGIQPEDVSIFLVNGVNSPCDTALKPSDMIALFPPVGGG